MAKGNFINGRWVTASGKSFESIDPAHTTAIWSGSSSTSDDVNKAFAAARAAFNTWSTMSMDDRLAPVLRFKELASEHKASLAKLIAQETGKVLWDATGEAGVVAAKVDVSIKSYHERTGNLSFDTGFGRAELQHRPHGVLAILGPYNFPAHLPNGQMLPALIAGNTFVFKPSELCPAVGEFLIDLYDQAGFPPGVINMVQGARNTGAAVLDNSELDGVLFTGSPGTGQFIHKKFGGRPEVLLALEMGGNNPLLFWDASNAEAAATHAVQSSFITSGQRCTCARRIILPKNRNGRDILDAIVAKTKGLKIGAWDDQDEAFMGPVVTEDIAKRVVDAATGLGGQQILAPTIMDRGCAFVAPSIIDVTGIEVPDEEIFGPVMKIIWADSFEHGIDIANATKYGLSAGLISDSAELWDKFKTKIRAGVVNFNRPTTGASGALPFGGPGLSGNHNPGAFYAADFCAWPMASQVADTIEIMTAKGM